MSNNQKSSNKTDKSGNRAARLRILDKEVQISCKPGEEDDLLQAAAYIDMSMRELRLRNSTSSIEKIAIVTAINTANALLKSRSLESIQAKDDQASEQDESDIAERLSVLNGKLDQLLNESHAEVTDELPVEITPEKTASSQGGSTKVTE